MKNSIENCVVLWYDFDIGNIKLPSLTDSAEISEKRGKIMATTEPIRSKDDLRRLADYFLERGQHRNYVMIVLGVHTTLRINDLLHLKWQDVYDETKCHFKTRIDLREQKTLKKKSIALNHQAIDALSLYYPRRRSEWIFVSRNGGKTPISRQQAWRIIKEACKLLEIDGNIACHSLRKTWGYHAWTDKSISPVVIMDIYNHSNYDVTRRYLGVAQDDLDRAYLEMDLF